MFFPDEVKALKQVTVPALHGWTVSRRWLAIVLGTTLAALAFLMAGCGPSPAATATPTRTTRPLAPTPQATPAAGAPVMGWLGSLFSFSPDSPYDDYFLRAEDRRQYGIVGGDSETRNRMNELRDTGVQVVITGTLFVGVDDLEGRRIVVSEIRSPPELFRPSPTPTGTAIPTAPPTDTATASPLPPTLTPTPTPLPDTPTPTPRAATPTPVPTLPPPPPTPVPTPVVITDWQGEYFPNESLAGMPSLVRNDIQINFDWGIGSPAPGTPADNFSVRWSRTVYFEAGDYRFRAYADDGVRVYLDRFLLINEWHTWQDQVYQNEFRDLGAGWHTVVVEYVDFGGLARVWADWEQITGIPPGQDRWQGEYYNSIVPGSNWALTRTDLDVNFDWGQGSPDGRVNSDNFSARWTRVIPLQGGNYRFWVRADDGVQVWLDGRLIISEWYDGVKELSTRVDGVSSEPHRLEVQYYERVDRAFVRFWWEYLGRDPGQPIP